jgi:hypothetical protein
MIFCSAESKVSDIAVFAEAKYWSSSTTGLIDWQTGWETAIKQSQLTMHLCAVHPSDGNRLDA